MNKERGSLKVLAVAAFTSFHLFLAAPLFLYAANASEFRVTLPTILVHFLPLFLFVLGLLFLLLRRLHRRGQFRPAAGAAALALYLYIQFFLLVRDYGILDGSPVDWARHNLAGYLEIGLLVLLLGLALGLGRRFLSAASLALAILIPGIALTVALELRRLAPESRHGIDHRELSYLEELSPHQNVVILVVDTLQSDIFEELVHEDAGLREALQGFVFFRDAAGLFPYTYLSIQAILTGEHYEPGETISGYRERVFDRYVNHSVIDQGGVASYLDPGNNLEYLTSLRAAQRHELARLYDLVLFRQVPHFLKPWILNDHSFRLSRLLAAPEVRLAVQRDLAVLRTLSSGSFVGRRELTFKLLHLWGSHLPVELSSDCTPLGEPSYTREDYKEHSRCVLGVVAEYLNMLRRLEVRDRSLIFLLSDHGSIFSVGEEDQFPDNVPDHVLSTAQATIAVKDFHSNQELRITDTPASLIDVAPTIRAGLDLPPSGAGMNLLKLGDAESRTRSFFYFKSANEVLEDALAGVDEFEIAGPSRQKSAWRLNRRHAGALEEFVEVIDFGTLEAARHLGPGWSGIEQADPTQSWSLIRNPSVYAVLPDRESVEMTVRLCSFIPGQRVTLTLNSRKVAEWEIPPDFLFREYSTRLPLRSNERGALNHFRLVIASEQQPSAEDVRKLGVSVDWIRFE